MQTRLRISTISRVTSRRRASILSRRFLGRKCRRWYCLQPRRYSAPQTLSQANQKQNLFSTRSEAEHREQRKKVANAYSLDSLLRLEDAVDGCGKLFLRKMQDYADQGQPVDLGAWLQYYGMSLEISIRTWPDIDVAFDVVGEFTFESRLGFLEKGTDVEGMMQAVCFGYESY